jgi:hypothetical protein
VCETRLEDAPQCVLHLVEGWAHVAFCSFCLMSRRSTRQAARKASTDSTSDTSVLAGLVFIVCGKLSKTQAQIKKIITDNGGTAVTKAADASLALVGGDGDNGGKVMQQCFDLGIPVLKEAFLHECIEQGKLVDQKDYLVDAPSGGKDDTKMKVNQKDAGDDEEDEEAEDDSKKNKRKRGKAAAVADDEVSDSEAQAPAKKKTKRAAASKKKKKEESEEEDEEEEEETPAAPGIATVVDLDAIEVEVDQSFPERGAQVVIQDGVIYDALLNQTDIGNNNNKYYVDQLVKRANGGYAVINR